MNIPQPDDKIVQSFEPYFEPSAELSSWVTATFLEPGGYLANADHGHLLQASIGFLWTNVEHVKKGRHVIGTAEAGAPKGSMGKWHRSRAERQVIDWFGSVPDFVITIFAPWWVMVDNDHRCALIEHELYHCAQDTDEFGQPKFSKQTGRPVFTIRGHDVEEFVGVVRRYGAVNEGVRELVDAANSKPQIAAVDIKAACGTCK